MKNFVAIILAIVVFASCRTPKTIIVEKTVIKDSTVRDTLRETKDTTIYIPGDTVSIHDSVPCPDAKYSKEVKKGGTTAKVSLNNGKLDVECKTDSLQLIIQMLRREVIRLSNFISVERTTTEQVPLEVPKPYIPKWVWWLVGFNVLYFSIKYRLTLLKGVTWLSKLFLIKIK